MVMGLPFARCSGAGIPTITSQNADDPIDFLGQDAVVNCFKAHGAILFRGFRVGLENFQSLVRSCSNCRLSYPGDQRKSVSSDSLVQTVAAGMGPIPLHSELSHTPFLPDVCWFYCVRAPRIGSETTLCDGAKLCTLLPAPAIDLLGRKMLRYKRIVPSNFWRFVLGISSSEQLKEFLKNDPRSAFFHLQGEDVMQDYVAPALHTSRFGTTPVFANNVLHNFRKGKTLTYPTFDDNTCLSEELILELGSAAASCTIDVQWKDEDLLVIDNTRMMHGRRAISDPNRTIWTQFSDAVF